MYLVMLGWSFAAVPRQARRSPCVLRLCNATSGELGVQSLVISSALASHAAAAAPPCCRQPVLPNNTGRCMGT